MSRYATGILNTAFRSSLRRGYRPQTRSSTAFTRLVLDVAAAASEAGESSAALFPRTTLQILTPYGMFRSTAGRCAFNVR